jgi:type III secretory pathway component EscT
VLAVALAAVIFPALLPPDTARGGSLWVQIVLQVWLGVPIAVAAAVPLWAATMAGGVADALRGANDVVPAPTVEGSATPMGVTLSLLASCMFFATGGPAHIAAALTRAELPPGAWTHVAEQLADGVTIAVALGAPLLAASVVVEVAGALIARAATPAQLHLVLAPLRALALLSVFALVFTAMSEALAVVVAHPKL